MKTQHTNKLPILLALISLLAAPLSAAPEGWLLDVDEAVTVARKTQRNILVDLYADWCGWCKVLERKVFTSPEFKRFAEDFVLLQVDVEDGAEGSEIQARYAVSSLPTMLILDPKMVKVGSVDGYAPKDAYIAQLRLRIEEYKSSLKYYEQARQADDIQTLKNLAQQLHQRGDGARAAVLYEKIGQQTKSGSPTAAWLQYLLADAYRLDKNFERAGETLNRAKNLAGSVDDRELAARVDFLRAHIARDLGDCKEAQASLETFLESHPSSPFTDQAMSELKALKRGDRPECT